MDLVSCRTDAHHSASLESFSGACSRGCFCGFDPDRSQSDNETTARYANLKKLKSFRNRYAQIPNEPVADVHWTGLRIITLNDPVSCRMGKLQGQPRE
jgi:hypothetical protein